MKLITTLPARLLPLPALLALILLLTPTAVRAQTAGLPRLMPEALETGLALSALPNELRAGAGVYLLRRGGYVQSRPAGNRYSCFVVRTMPRFDVQSPDTLIPICYDEEGMRRMAVVHLDIAALREQGHTPEEIRGRIQAGFESGKYRAPERTGLSYMISPVLNLPDGKGGVWNYPPHFMVYAPGVTNELVDGRPNRGEGWLPWINEEGPHGMFIVPVGVAEREKLQQESAALIRQVERFLREG